MLAWRLKTLVIPMKNSWTIYKNGIGRAVTSANYSQCQTDKGVTIVQNYNHYYAKIFCNPLPSVNYLQKYQLCMQIPSKEKPADASSKSGNVLNDVSAIKSQSLDPVSSSQSDYTSSNNEKPKIMDTVQGPDINLSSRDPVASSQSDYTSPNNEKPKTMDTVQGPDINLSSRDPVASSQSDYTSPNNEKPKTMDSVQGPDIKLPSRDEMERLFFRTVIIFWDFAVYLNTITMKLIQKYILDNPTFKQYWNIFLQKLENARKDIKK